MTAFVSPSKSTGNTTMFARRRLAEAGLDSRCKFGGTSVSRMRFFSTRALADQALAQFDALSAGWMLRVAREQHERGALVRRSFRMSIW